MTSMADILAFQKKKSPGDPPLRQGKWTREEEEYVHCLIDEFKTGMMPLAEGTSLRTFLSKMLNCHPMRISKKFVGSNYNGKQVYSRRTGDDRLSNEEVKARRDKLCDLERKFLAKIAPKKNQAKPNQVAMQQQQEQKSAQTQSPVPPSALAALSRVSTSGVDLRNLLNQAALKRGEANNASSELSRNLSLLEMPLNDNGPNNSSSSQSLQNLFQELVSGGKNSTGSLTGLNLLLQQNAAANNIGGSNHFSSNRGSNSRAAAAGRALLQSGFGLDKKPAPSATSNKPLSSFTSAELAAELRNRSSLQDLVAQLGNGGGSSSSASNNNGAASRQNSSSFGQSLASLQGSLKQGSSDSNSALGNLIRNSSIDVSNLMERQGSIDSLSNLAIRSRLQSIQSMGSLLDPLLDGGSGKNNSNWTAKNAAASLAAKVSTDNLNGSQTGRELMESLGVGRASLNSFNAGAGSSSSGLNLASLLNNDDALRRLEASAPSSLNSNFNFLQQQENGSDSSSEANTALEQFLLQKKLQGKDNSGNNSSHSDQQQLMMNVAAGSGSSGGGIDPIMSSLLSSLRNNNNNDMGGGSSESDFDTLKRKFLEQAGDGFMEHRKNKPFR